MFEPGGGARPLKTDEDAIPWEALLPFPAAFRPAEAAVLKGKVLRRFFPSLADSELAEDFALYVAGTDTFELTLSFDLFLLLSRRPYFW